jgi:hypothetical protein
MGGDESPDFLIFGGVRDVVGSLACVCTDGLNASFLGGTGYGNKFESHAGHNKQTIDK